LSSSDSNLILLVKSDLPMSEHALSSASFQAIQRNVPGLQVGPPRSVRTARIGEVQQIAVYAGVATVFATVTLLVLAIGVFGATSHLVARRAREIAIRQAVGATAAQARRPVAATLGRWWLAAVVGGIAISAAGAKVVAASQAGLVPMTLATVTWSVVVITTALVVAALPPLRRAQRVSPALLMRSE
jgi:ABC-type antimicrobial peptide transport system permease subunit